MPSVKRPERFAVGATLLYPDRTIQHAGLLPRSDGMWIHPYRGHPATDPGAGGELRLVRSVPAVTAACVLDPGIYFVMNSPAAIIGTDAAKAAQVISSWGFVITPEVVYQDVGFDEKGDDSNGEWGGYLRFQRNF